MKFKINIGHDDDDGQVQYEDGALYGGLDFTDIPTTYDEPQHWWDNAYYIFYNDEVTPIISIKEGKVYDGNEWPSLTEAEIEYYSAFASSISIREQQRIAAEEAAYLERVARENFEPWLTWGSVPRKRRDTCLTNSDPYSNGTITSPNADAWLTWRQWLRDLPANNTRPVDITVWNAPPDDANQLVTAAYEALKRRVTECRRLDLLWNPPAE